MSVSASTSSIDDAEQQPAQALMRAAPGWHLTPLEWLLLAALATALVAYLPVVVHRTVTRGFGDVQVFFRAGWAIWSGYPLYDVTDHHGWSYHYPPFFALLMGPFANPLPGRPLSPWALSFQASVAVWYAICAAALVATQHVWANAVQRFSAIVCNRNGFHPWWLLRVVPLLMLLPFAGDGLGRGQPAAILTLSMAGFVVLYAAKRPYAAALALSVGIAIKLFPAALALIPLLRRDLRTLLAIGAFTAMLLFVVPAVCLGPAATLELYQVMWTERLSGILAGSPTPRVASEISFLSYDMGSIGAMAARIAAGGVPSLSMPVPGWAMAVQLIANTAIVAALIVTGHGRFWRTGARQPDSPYAVLVAGALICAILPAMLSVAQPNYWVQALPLLTLLLAEEWRRRRRIEWSLTATVFTGLIWYAFVSVEKPGWEPIRIVGLATPLFLVAWIAGLRVLWTLPQSPSGFAGPAVAPSGLPLR